MQHIRRLPFRDLLLLLEEISLELQFRHDLRTQGLNYDIQGETADSEESSSSEDDEL